MIRDAALRDRLMKIWKTDIKQRPLAERLAWLQQQAILAGLGREGRQLQKSVAESIEQVETAVPSEPWARAIIRAGDSLPAGMVRGRGLIRIGIEGKASRRMTPGIAVDVEDVLDTMTAREADAYQFPARSSSALALERLQMYGRRGLSLRERRRAERIAGAEQLSHAPIRTRSRSTKRNRAAAATAMLEAVAAVGGRRAG